MKTHFTFRFFFFCLLHLLCFRATLNAQDYVYRHISLEDGLPSSFVTALMQDSDAYLWIATDQGVARYDGSVRLYNHPDGGTLTEVIIPRSQLDD